MRLKSTYRDYYDWAFGRDGPVYLRVGGNTGPPKREQFRLLSEGGFRVPPHGLVKDVHGTWWEDEKKCVRWVVAYEDEMAHCAEGKRVIGSDQLKWQPVMGRCSHNDERDRLAELYCTAFCGSYPQTFTGGAVSWRRLQVGRHVFWVEYRSAAGWLSNFGDGTCEVVGVEMDAGYHPHFRSPLFAIDFVVGREMYAVDLNYGPGIRGSGVEKLLPAELVVRSIEEWFEEVGDGVA